MPMANNIKLNIDLDILGSLCNSGIKSDIAIYKNPPAAKGNKNEVISWNELIIKYPTTAPAMAVRDDTKFQNKALAFEKPP